MSDRTNRAALVGIVGKLLVIAATAWSVGDVESAERVTAGAWRMLDGAKYVDDDCPECGVRVIARTETRS